MLNLEPIKERLSILLSDIPEWVIKDLQQLTEELERTRFILNLKEEQVKDLKKKLNEQTEPEESIYVGDFNGYKYYLSPVNTESQKSWLQALEYCKSLTIDGHSDWHLPNKKELNFLYKNKNNPPLAQGFRPYCYWSSSEYSRFYAWNQLFTNGFRYFDFKPNLGYVRAIRKEKI